MKPESPKKPLPLPSLLAVVTTAVVVGVLESMIFGFGVIMLLELPLRLLLGWLMHGYVMLPPFLAQWPKALLPLLCLALAVWLAHRFIRWWIPARGSTVDWKSGHTIAVTALLLLGSAAAIAMSGIVHQVVWLGGIPWFGNSRAVYRQANLEPQAREIQKALAEYSKQRGRYPESLERLESDGLLPRGMTRMEMGTSGLTEPFLLLRPGATRAEVRAEPLFVSPLIPPWEEIVVGISDGRIKRVPAGELDRILETPNRSAADE